MVWSWHTAWQDERMDLAVEVPTREETLVRLEPYYSVVPASLPESQPEVCVYPTANLFAPVLRQVHLPRFSRSIGVSQPEQRVDKESFPGRYPLPQERPRPEQKGSKSA
jgi:hypothetical protein